MAIWGSVAQGLDGGGADAQVAEDLRPVAQAAHDEVVVAFAVHLGGHDQGVAGHDLGTFKAAEPAGAFAAEDRAVGAQHKGFAGFGVFGQAGGLDDVTHGATGFVDEHVFVVDAAGHGHKGGLCWHHDGVAVFQRHVGQLVQGGTQFGRLTGGALAGGTGFVGVQLQSDTALAAQGFEFVDLGALLGLLLLCQRGGLGGAFVWPSLLRKLNRENPGYDV